MTKQKNKGGRPPLYDDPEVMQERIDAYFEQCGDKPTIAGLCYFLGFEDRDALADYGKKDKFSRTVKKARLRVEGVLEARLFEPAPAGVIFNLKNNWGWKDKQETEITGKDGAPLIMWGQPIESK